MDDVCEMIEVLDLWEVPSLALELSLGVPPPTPRPQRADGIISRERERTARFLIEILARTFSLKRTFVRDSVGHNVTKSNWKRDRDTSKAKRVAVTVALFRNTPS